MSTTLMPPGQRAQQEFALAQLGDSRRNKRLVKIATHLAAHPGGTLPQAFPDWAELKAAYRFFGQSGVTFQRVLAPHLERTRQRCRQPGEYLLIEETTLLDDSRHPATAGLGVIGDGGGRGFELHSALAVRIESWTLEQRPEGLMVGWFDQQCRRPRPAPPGETRGQRLSRPRKSQRWAAAIPSAARPAEGSQWIYVADRESDIYEVLQRCRQHGVDFVIRAGQAGVWPVKPGMCGRRSIQRRCWPTARWQCDRVPVKTRARPAWSCVVCAWLWTGRGVQARGRCHCGTWASSQSVKRPCPKA